MTTATIMDPVVDFSIITGSMTTSDECLQQEVRGMTDCLFRPKTNIPLRTWHVRTIFESSKTAQVISEMKRYKLDILGISEWQWTASG